MADLSCLFALADSAVVQAGAGTGKTHSLITLCLHLLGGVGRGEPLPPARLCAVTFTEKAAAELSSRLRLRVDRVAALSAAPAGPERESALRAAEPELVATAAGSPLPEASVWRRVRRELGLAQIGTIHSLCGQILRRNAAAAGLDPGFAQLDELSQRELLREACERAALEALEGGPLQPAARRLCAELGYGGKGAYTRGLVGELVGLLRTLAEGGRDPAAAVEATSALDRSAAEAAFAEAQAGLLAAFAALESGPAARGARRAATGGPQAELCARFRPQIWPALAGAAPGELRAARAAARELARLLVPRGAGARSEAMVAFRDAWKALLDADAHARACALARDLGAVAARAQACYAEARGRAGALDFDDLVRRARDLLATDPRARRAEKARIGALLVDEFQDTSRPQLELFGFLAEGEREAAGGGGAGPVAQGRLVVVGDRKQSIYDFRGADVAGSQGFARAALAAGARRYLLLESRRSRPALVELCNRLFETVLEGQGRPFDTPFVRGEDDLTARRPEGSPGPCAELIDVAQSSSIDEEAEALGRRIAQLLAEGAPERVREAGPDGSEVERPVRGGDVAILLRATTHLEAYRRALLARRIPHLVLKGSGLPSAREIVDLRALLSLALDPDDALSLAAVLRSPLGPVSDDGLVLLARAPRGADGADPGGGLRLRALADPLVLDRLAPDDREAAMRIGHLVAHLRREASRLGPAALLEAALADSDYVAAAAGGLFGEQAAANVDRLLALARAHELRGGDLASFLARLDALEEGAGADAAEAPVVEERDPHAVRILTVHAAKGLEFPVVVVPGCGQGARSNGDTVLIDADLGVAMKVRGADGLPRWGPHGEAVVERKKQREEAQARRLFYVAATRARDLLVLVARKPSGDSWRAFLDPALEDLRRRQLLRVLPAEGLAAPPLPRGRAALDSAAALEVPAEAAQAAPARAAARAAVSRSQEAAPKAAPGTLVAPVTQLASAIACARRYHLLHEAGLEERPSAREPWPALLDPDAEAERPAAEQGTLAHRLLELVPLGLPDAAARRRALVEVLAAEGEDPAEHGAVLEACEGFLASPLAARMARAEGGRLRLHREHPFALHLAPAQGPALVVRGQLDALLLDGNSATVVDYKHAQRQHPERYAAQLDAYALAAHDLLGGAVPVRTGLVFLRSPGAPFVERPAATSEDLSATRARLLAAASAIVEGRRTGAWPKVEPDRCRALGCGFLPRCHPAAGGPEPAASPAATETEGPPWRAPPS